jgi:hypothetical protein
VTELSEATRDSILSTVEALKAVKETEAGFELPTWAINITSLCHANRYTTRALVVTYALVTTYRSHVMFHVTTPKAHCHHCSVTLPAHHHQHRQFLCLFFVIIN